MGKDYYKILGVQRNADDDALKSVRFALSCSLPGFVFAPNLRESTLPPPLPPLGRPTASWRSSGTRTAT
jgi:hypothetical protein